jgi:hypothetical protein
VFGEDGDVADLIGIESSDCGGRQRRVAWDRDGLPLLPLFVADVENNPGGAIRTEVGAPVSVKISGEEPARIPPRLEFGNGAEWRRGKLRARRIFARALKGEEKNC